jgi:hypothetical protein
MKTPSELGRLREKKYAKRIGGQLQPASGALNCPRHKGDIKTKLFLIDSKLTGKKVYLLTADTLEKITREALAINKIPALSVEVGGEQFVILRDQDFQAIREEYENAP